MPEEAGGLLYQQDLHRSHSVGRCGQEEKGLRNPYQEECGYRSCAISRSLGTAVGTGSCKDPAPCSSVQARPVPWCQ